jgi:hypothetical protein
MLAIPKSHSGWGFILGIGDDIFIPMVGLDANYRFVNVDVVVQFGKGEMFE